MNLPRIFANAIARRLAYILVAATIAAVATFFAPSAKAQSCGVNVCTYSSQGAAYAGCMAQASAAASAPPTQYNSYGQPKCPPSGPIQARDGYQCQVTRFNQNGTVNNSGFACNGVGAFQEHHRYPPAETCASKPSETTTRMPLTGSMQCISGCMTTYMLNGDDETSTRSTTGAICANTKDNCAAGTFYNTRMDVCQPIAPECKENETLKEGLCVPDAGCPDGMVAVTGLTPGAVASGELYCKPKANECPPGNIKAPSGQCLPGEGQCAAGEAKKPDGTCGKDTDGDGDADDVSDDGDSTNDSFSGGDSCNAPPSCSGHPIMCGQARIQWRIDCNTRTNENVTGGSCAAVPVCTGEKCRAMEYSQLLMQWRTACALEKQAGEGDAPGGGDSTTAEYLAAARAADKGQWDASAALGDGHEGTNVEGMWATNVAGSLTPGMFGSGPGGSCDFGTPLEIGGQAITIDPRFWALLAIIGWIVTASAYLWVAYLLM